MISADPNSFDAGVRGWVVAHQWAPAVTAMALVSRVASVNPMLWAGLVAAGLLAIRGRRRSAAALLAAPGAAYLVVAWLKPLLARERPAGLGHVVEDTFSFPSAHATTSAAVCCAVAWMFHREGLMTAPIAATIAVAIPLVVGLSRVYLDAHWATDVLGGWAIGVAIAAASGAVRNHWSRVSA